MARSVAGTYSLWEKGYFLECPGYGGGGERCAEDCGAGE